MVKVNTFGVMAKFILANGEKISETGMVNILAHGGIMKVSGKIV